MRALAPRRRRRACKAIGSRGASGSASRRSRAGRFSTTSLGGYRGRELRDQRRFAGEFNTQCEVGDTSCSGAAWRLSRGHDYRPPVGMLGLTVAMCLARATYRGCCQRQPGRKTVRAHCEPSYARTPRPARRAGHLLAEMAQYLVRNGVCVRRSTPGTGLTVRRRSALVFLTGRRDRRCGFCEGGLRSAGGLPAFGGELCDTVRRV